MDVLGQNYFYQINLVIVNNTLNKKDTLEKLLVGVNTLANVVKTTSGSKGHTILIEYDKVDATNQKVVKIPYITKDGVTVARHIKCQDVVENMGCQLLQQAAELTVNQAGDGTSSTIIMSQSLIQSIIELNVEDHRTLFEQIEKATEYIQEQLKKSKRKIKSLKDCIRVATISTNNKDLGELVGTVMWDARENGVVLFELSENGETYVYQEFGSRYERMYDLKQFLGSTGTKVSYDSPLVICIPDEVTSIDVLMPHLESTKEENRALVIIAPDYSKLVLQILEFNAVKNGYKILPLFVPGYGEEKKEYFKDIQALVSNDNIDKVVATKSDFTLFTKDMTLQLQNRIDVLSHQIGQEKQRFYKEKIEKRLSTLSQKVFTIYAGATSEIEQNELKDRMEDGLLATRAALEDGYVLGGGLALYNIAQSMPMEGYGNQIMYQVVTSPAIQILENAEAADEAKNLKDNYGFNTTSMQVEDFYKSGIIDPYKVISCSLNNAVSVAKTIISLNGAICQM